MTAEIIRTKKPNMVEVHYKNQFLGYLFHEPKDKTFWISVGGTDSTPADTFWDFTSKEKAIGKMIHYYGLK